MKKRIALFLIAIIMLVQPFATTLSLAVEQATNQETVNVSESFNDDALYGALKEILGGNASYLDEENKIQISNEKVQEITKLVLENKQISNITGLEIFTNLGELDLSGNELDRNSNLEELNSLVNLSKLDLSSNKIEDVSSISGLLNKEGLEIDLQGQDFKVVDFIDTIKVNTEEVADSLLNAEKQTLNLAEIFTAYEGTNTEIKELEINGTMISDENIKNYVSINNEESVIEFIPENVNKYNISVLINSDIPTNKTKCSYKLFKIDKETQTGIVFQDENLYKAVRDQLKRAVLDGGYGYTSWTYDDEDFIIIANKTELDAVDIITVNSKGVKDLTGLEKFVGLKSLDLADNSIISLNIISQLYINKNARTEELKAKYNKLVSELTKYLTDNSAAEEEIRSLKAEIEAIEKAVAASQATNQEETIQEKQEKINNHIQKINELTVAIQAKIEEINELLNTATGYGIPNVLTSPVAREEIEKATEILEDNINIEFIPTTTNATKNEIINEELEILKNNKTEELVNLINASLNNLTDDEFSNVFLDNTLTVDGENIITEIDISRIQSKFAKEEICTYIDKLNNEDTVSFVSTFNSGTGLTIKTKETVTVNGTETEKDKSASVLKQEMKTAINNKYISGNFKSDFDAIILLYQTIKGLDEEQLKLDLSKKSKEDIMNTIKNNLSKKQQKMNDEMKKEIAILKITYVTGTSIYYDELRAGLNLQAQRLLEMYEDLNNILERDGAEIETILSAATERDITTGNFVELSDLNKTNLLSIANRLSQVPEEEKNAVIKSSDLETLNLSRNMISDVKELEKVPTIKNLYLEYNLISSFDFEKFDNLEILSLRGNCLQEVEIARMTNLRRISLAENRLDNVDKINLAGLEKIEMINLDDNEIADIEKLLASKNVKLIRAGYDTLSDYIKANPATSIIDVSIMNQELSLNIELEAKEGVQSEIVELPKIFKQVKSLQNDEIVKVVYSKSYPCTNVFSDGTKANIDTTQTDVRKTGTAMIDMTTPNGVYDDSYFAYGTVCRINYIVSTDKVAPTISGITGNTENWTKEDVTITVVATDDKSTTLSYSFDNGNTWQPENTKTYSENTNGIIIKVKDEKGNVSEPATINITKIDKTVPTISSIQGISEEKTKEDVTITIVAIDGESEISEYSFDNGTTWQVANTKTYSENTANIVAKVKDNAGNVFTAEAVSITNIDKAETPDPNENTDPTEDPDPTPSLEIDSDEYVIENTKSYITSDLSDITASQLKNNISNNATSVIIKNKNGEEIEDNEMIGTGMTVEFTLGEEKKTLTVVIDGDLTGDGLVEDADLLRIARYLTGDDTSLEGAYLEAADIISDGTVDDRDILKIARKLAELD